MVNFCKNVSKHQKMFAVSGSFLWEKCFFGFKGMFFFCQFSLNCLKTPEKLFSCMWLNDGKNTFLNLKRCFCQFPQKCFKTTKKLSLAVCGSFQWEKHFFGLKAIFFFQFLQNASKQQKSLFNCTWLNLMSKALFNPKRCFFLSISAKMLQNTRKA